MKAVRPVVFMQKTEKIKAAVSYESLLLLTRLPPVSGFALRLQVTRGNHWYFQHAVLSYLRLYYPLQIFQEMKEIAHSFQGFLSVASPLARGFKLGTQVQIIAIFSSTIDHRNEDATSSVWFSVMLTWRKTETNLSNQKFIVLICNVGYTVRELTLELHDADNIYYNYQEANTKCND